LGSTIYSRMSRAGAQRVVTTLFRIMGRRDGAGVRLITRYGDDFTSRFPHRVWPNRTSNNSWALPKKHTAGQRFRLFCLTRETTNSGVSMSRANQTADVHDDAIIAFLLFCLEVYKTEQQRKRTLH
jgi:hypothetical protein